MRVVLVRLKILTLYIFDNYDVKADEIWMNKDWFYVPTCGSFVEGRNAIRKQPYTMDNYTI